MAAQSPRHQSRISLANPIRLLRRPSTRATATAMASAALVVGFILAIPLAADLTFVGLDLFRTELGTLCEIRHQLAAGTLWLAPHLGNGQPLFADPPAQLLYPPQWLAASMAPDVGASVAAVVQLAIGASGAAWLVRSHGVRTFAAACFGICFAFSGTALNLIWHASYLSAAAWLPWVWASGRRMLQGSSSRFPAVCLLSSLTLLLLGAEPMSFGVGIVVIALEASVRIARSASRRAATRATMRILLLTIAAVAIGMAQWLPASAEVSLTSRAGAMDSTEALRWSFSPPQWFAAVMPGILAERVAPGTSFWLLWNGPHALAPWNSTPYFGPLLVVLAALGARQRRSRLASAFGVAALVMALGDSVPIVPGLLKLAPWLAVFRYPSKLLLPVTLAAIVAAGVVLQTLCRSPKTERRAFVAMGGTVGVALALGAVGVFVFHSALDQWASNAPATESTGGGLPNLSALLFRAALQGAAPLFIALGLVTLRKYWPKVLPLLVCADLLLASPSALFVGPRLGQIVSPLADLSSARGDVVVCHSSEVFKVTFRLKEESGPWSESMALLALAAPNLGACSNLRTAVGYSLLQTRVNARLESALLSRSAAAARALGCTHLVALGPPLDEESRVVPTRFGGSLIRVAEIADPIPDGFVAARPRWVTTETELIDLVLATHSVADVVSLVDDPLKRLPNAGQLLPLGTAVAIRRVEHRAPDRFRLELVGSGGAVVGVRTSFQAGWRASQSGRELPVIRSAGEQVAVLVDDVAGGDVELEYRPALMKAGFAFALAGLLLGMFAALSGVGSRRVGGGRSAARDR